MSWFLSLGSCIDYTKEFQTEKEGIEYLKNHPKSKDLGLYKLDYGFSELGKEDEDESE